MKLVEFTTSMAPHAKGDTRVVPDEVAAKLLEDGVAVPRDSVFDAQPSDAAKAVGRKRPYLTRKLL